jgi:NADP-dependent 3-hydroxy acid dehydrogenase YdfG
VSNPVTVADRAALVTGASAGIGLAIAAALAHEGYSVTMSARSADRLEAACQALRAGGSDVVAVAADAGDDDATAALVADHLSRCGRLDVVVANAGTGYIGTVADSRARDVQRMTSLNVLAPFALAREAMPALRASAAGDGRPWFIVTSSISGVWPTPGFAGYSATKAAAVSLARSITFEEGAAGVRACAICPAFVDTDMTAWTHDRVPPGTMLHAQDVAEAVCFLLRLSPNASVPELVLHRTGAPTFVP